jgi:hypothetical protein
MPRRIALFRALLCGLLFCSCLAFAQAPLLSDLTIDTSDGKDSLLAFTLSTSGSHSISGIKLHFLTGIDCYSGYLARYEITQADRPFPISNQTTFALSAKGTYHAAQTVVDSAQIDSIQAVLIQFISPERGPGYDRYLRFMGSCQDQEINCCMPIACSQGTEQCSPLTSMDKQDLVW